jgi:hypothetical protein
MPALAGMVGAPIAATYPSAVTGFLLALGIQALGYIGGVYYSLSFIRKVALIARPLACVKPSIITFAVLAVLGFIFNVLSSFGGRAKEMNPIIANVGLVVFYIVILFAFVKITQNGFRAIESQMAPQSTADATSPEGL